MSTSTNQWAAWFRESAAQADDLTEGQREGFRIAAEHLECPRVRGLVARIDIPAAEVDR